MKYLFFLLLLSCAAHRKVEDPINKLILTCRTGKVDFQIVQTSQGPMVKRWEQNKNFNNPPSKEFPAISVGDGDRLVYQIGQRGAFKYFLEQNEKDETFYFATFKEVVQFKTKCNLN